jgi:hypothetical protein
MKNQGKNVGSELKENKRNKLQEKWFPATKTY